MNGKKEEIRKRVRSNRIRFWLGILLSAASAILAVFNGYRGAYVVMALNLSCIVLFVFSLGANIEEKRYLEEIQKSEALTAELKIRLDEHKWLDEHKRI